MDQEEARRILSEYYKGTTGEDEESALAEFFSGDNVPDDLYLEREWFRSRSLADVPEPGDEFYARLDAIAKEDKPLSAKGRRVLPWYYRVAATIALLISGYLIMHNLYSKPSYMKDTYSDPQLAMAEVKRVLNDVSLNMKKGSEALPELNSLGQAQSALNTFKSASYTASKSFQGLKSNIRKPQTKDKE